MRSRCWLRGLLVLILNTSVLSSSLSAGDFLRPSHAAPGHEGERWARRTLKKLSLEEKIGQMFMVRVLTRFMNVEDPDYLTLRDQIARYHPGSILLTVPVDGPFL